MSDDEHRVQVRADEIAKQSSTQITRLVKDLFLDKARRVNKIAEVDVSSCARRIAGEFWPPGYHSTQEVYEAIEKLVVDVREVGARGRGVTHGVWYELKCFVVGPLATFHISSSSECVFRGTPEECDALASRLTVVIKPKRDDS